MGLEYKRVAVLTKKELKRWKKQHLNKKIDIYPVKDYYNRTLYSVYVWE